jgi:dihydrolipoamide dehydrogenase
MDNNYDYIIIGSGPAGYVLASKLGEIEKKVLLIEDKELGGVCLNNGCIPTKTILRSSILFENITKSSDFGIETNGVSLNYLKVLERKEQVVRRLRLGVKGLLSKNKVSVISGHAIYKDNSIFVKDISYSYQDLIICTGSINYVPNIKGLDNNKFVIDSDTFLNLDKLEDNVVIIGGGVIGLEIAGICLGFNKNVTILEKYSILPLLDEDIKKEYLGTLTKKGLKYYENCNIQEIKENKIYLENLDVIETNLIITACGRIPNLELAKEAGLETKKGIIVNENYETSIPHIYAIGDVLGRDMLAYVATSQAINLFSYFTGKEFNASTPVPVGIFTSIELSYIGKTEKELNLENIEYKRFIFPIMVNGKSRCDGETSGLIKILTSINNKILGVFIISSDANELINYFSLIMENNLDIKSISDTLFIHPSKSELIFEISNFLIERRINL